MNGFDLVVDAIFGSNVEHPIKQPYREFIHAFADLQKKVFSVSIPSGWSVDKGNTFNLFIPKFVISIGIPFDGMEEFNGRHFLGGRFIPSKWQEIKLPEYKNEETFLELL